MLDLLERFYDLKSSTTHGMITIDSVDIQCVPIGIYRQVVAYVEHEPRIFPAQTVLENLYLGLSNDGKEMNILEVTKVCETVRLIDVMSAPGSLRRLNISSFKLLERKK